MGLEEFRGKSKMNKFVPISKREKERRDKRDMKLYDLVAPKPDPINEEFERRLERGEVTKLGEEILSLEEND
jgi:hypothetical protein